PVNEQTLFQIGSITKSFVSAIILQLEADPTYHFSINDKLGKFFPEYPKWQDVTIKQLMNMTSGIPSYSNSEVFFEKYSADPYYDSTYQDMLNMVKDQDVLFKPGKQWDYSNTNYILM